MLARRWRRALDAHLVASGLSDATMGALMHLHELGDGVTQQKQLAARVGLDGSSSRTLLDILSRQGLLERRTDATDARARLVFLTQAGRARVAKSARRWSRLKLKCCRTFQMLSSLPCSGISR